MAINGNNIDGSVYRPIQDYDNNPNYINDVDPNINFYNENTHTFMQGCKYFLEDDLNKVYGDNVNLQTGLPILQLILIMSMYLSVLKDEKRVPLTYNRSGRGQIYVDNSGCHYSHVALFNGMESHCTLNTL